MNRRTRRRFLAEAAGTAASALLWNGAANAFATASFGAAADAGPGLRFPTQPRDRVSVSSYPFRDFIAGLDDAAGASSHKMPIKDFAAHVVGKFNVNKIEPWSQHFLKLDPTYLEEIRVAVKNAGAAIINIAADGEHSPSADEQAEREKAVEFGKKWIDVAIAIGSPSIRTNIPEAKGIKPDVERTAQSLRRVAEYGSQKKVVVNLENDNPVSEDPDFITQVVDKVNSPWLHALPDFANTLATGNEAHAYAGIDAMFARAYSICHVKSMEANDAGRVFHVDMPKTFGILKSHGYKGYCSMEWEGTGDPYTGTQGLIADTVKYLS